MDYLNMTKSDNIRLDDFKEKLNISEVNEIDLSKTFQKSVGMIDAEYVSTTDPKALNYIVDDENIVWRTVLNTQHPDDIVNESISGDYEFSEVLISYLTKHVRVDR